MPEQYRGRLPFYTFDDYAKRTYGGKCAKITLDAGCTCPHMDPLTGRGGCIYCSARGSGDFSAPATLPLSEQYRLLTARVASKWNVSRFIPYLQAHTNTYGPVDRLAEIYDSAAQLPGAVALHIATRADCLQEEVLQLLAVTASRIPLTVELGLQTVHDDTGARINRGHDFATFLKGYRSLREKVPRARIGIHLINGLPGEMREQMLQTVRTVAALSPDEVKFHVLLVLRGTLMAEQYARGEYTPMTQQEYVGLLCEQITMLPPDTVVGRICSDAGEQDLIAPLWVRRKLCMQNAVYACMHRAGLWQGKRFRILN